MKCKGKTHGKTFPYPTYSCSRNEWKDGYCKTHHPDEVLKRRKKSSDLKEAQYQEYISRKKEPVFTLNDMMDCFDAGAKWECDDIFYTERGSRTDIPDKKQYFKNKFGIDIDKEK